MRTISELVAAGVPKRWEVRGNSVLVVQANAEIQLRLSRGPEEIGAWSTVDSGAAFRLPRGQEFDAIEVTSPVAQRVKIAYALGEVGTSDIGLSFVDRALLKGNSYSAWCSVAAVAAQYGRICLENTETAFAYIVDSLRVYLATAGHISFFSPAAAFANAGPTVKNRNIGMAAAPGLSVTYETGAALLSTGVEFAQLYASNNQYSSNILMSSGESLLLPPGTRMAVEYPTVNVNMRVIAVLRRVEI